MQMAMKPFQRRPTPFSANNLGFTLVELMIVVAVVAILTAIAIPAYNNYIATSARNSARAVLEQVPLLIETYRAENGRMCPLCTPAANGGPFVYGYTENAAGVENTAGNRIRAAFPEFKPKGEAVAASLYHYSISFTTAGCPANCQESATATASPAPGGTAPPGNIVSNPYQ